MNMFYNPRRFFTDVLYKQEYFTWIQKILIVHKNHYAVILLYSSLLIHKIMNYDYFYNSMPHLRLYTFIQPQLVHLCKEIIFVHRTYIMFSLSSCSLCSITSSVFHVHTMRNSIRNLVHIYPATTIALICTSSKSNSYL